MKGLSLNTRHWGTELRIENRFYNWASLRVKLDNYKNTQGHHHSYTLYTGGTQKIHYNTYLVNF